MPWPTTGYLPRTVTHLIEVYDEQYSRVFRYEATIPLDGMSMGVTADLLDKVNALVTAAGLASLDPAGTYTVQAGYHLSGTADIDITPGAEA